MIHLYLLATLTMVKWCNSWLLTMQAVCTCAVYTLFQNGHHAGKVMFLVCYFVAVRLVSGVDLKLQHTIQGLRQSKKELTNL